MSEGNLVQSTRMGDNVFRLKSQWVVREVMDNGLKVWGLMLIEATTWKDGSTKERNESVTEEEDDTIFCGDSATETVRRAATWRASRDS